MLQEVKEVLKITWNDEDNHIQGIIDRGKGYIEGLTGTKIDFETNELAKYLLINYCRYDYNSASEYFEENFGNSQNQNNPISRLQLLEAVKENEEIGGD